MKTWNNINLETYQRLYKCSNLFERLEVLSGLKATNLMNGSIKVVESIIEEWKIVLTEKIPASKEIFLNIEGVKYQNDLSELSAGQWVDLQILRINPLSQKEKNPDKIAKLNEAYIVENLHEIISILIKPEKILYSDWKQEEFYEKVKKCSIVEVYGVVNFFLNIQNRFGMTSKDYLNLLKFCLKENLKTEQRKLHGLTYFANLPKTIFKILRVSLI